MAHYMGDPELDSLLREFKAGTSVLIESAGDEHRRAAQRLCEISRDIHLRLGLPNFAPRSLLVALVDALSFAAESIETSEEDQYLAEFRNNIQTRADLLKDRLWD